MNYEKVLFAYPTLVKEGMPAGGFYPPDAVLFNVDPHENHSIVITVGFVTTSAGNYWNEIDVVLNGKSVISTEHDGESTFNILLSTSPSLEQHVTVSSFFLKAVKLPEAGLYTAKVSLYDSDSNGNKGQLIDKKECSFIVAEESKRRG
ncbi:TPA: hypothetical protein ACT0TC_003899 [Klebsiella aerogenes]|uniref:hypothetical protein n=1 Tax=Klebsiella aerogenes TaxID=548 RepID=UPI001C8C5DE7|nr:hypothetical protein [Klebsiella aerogenes]MBX9066226.1 hypothetical protein [Klebsiella aerogenes]